MPRGDNFRGKKPEGSGRKRGQSNHVTADVRAAMAEVIQGNFEKFGEMLNKIKDPKHYCEVFLKACEYNIPKLAKVEQTVRHAVTAKDMTDAELHAVAGTGAVIESGGTGSESPPSRPH